MLPRAAEMVALACVMSPEERVGWKRGWTSYTRGAAGHAGRFEGVQGLWSEQEADGGCTGEERTPSVGARNPIRKMALEE